MFATSGLCFPFRKRDKDEEILGRNDSVRLILPLKICVLFMTRGIWEAHRTAEDTTDSRTDFLEVWKEITECLIQIWGAVKEETFSFLDAIQAAATAKEDSTLPKTHSFSNRHTDTHTHASLLMKTDIPVREAVTVWPCLLGKDRIHLEMKVLRNTI